MNGFLTLELDLLHVSESGSLSITGPLMLIGPVMNEGTIAAWDFQAYTSTGNHINTGLVQAPNYRAMGRTVANLGSVVANESIWYYGLDSVSNYGTMTTRFLDAEQVFWNYGTATADSALFHCLMNDGHVAVMGRLELTGPSWNWGQLHFGRMRTTQNLTNDITGTIACAKLEQAGNFENHGRLQVFDTLYNGMGADQGDLRLDEGSATEARNFINGPSGILYGPGILCIAQYSANHGWLVPSIRICDVTTTTTVSPFMDVNDGFVPSPIVGCGPNDCSSVGVAEIATATQPLIFPQPVNGSFTIDLGESATGMASMCLLDPIGKVIQTMVGPFGPQVRVDVQEGPSGICLLQGFDDKGRQVFATRVTLIN